MKFVWRDQNSPAHFIVGKPKKEDVVARIGQEGDDAVEIIYRLVIVLRNLRLDRGAQGFPLLDM